MASNAATYQCPHCNGVLAFDANSGKLVCAHCGGVFDPSQQSASIPVGAAVQQGGTSHVKTVDGFLERAPWTVGEDGTANAVVYNCPSCGANVAADQSTVSTSCPYCGNNMLVAGIATAANIPDKVLPFALTKEQAESRMREHFKHKWYLSRKFEASLEHMQAVYVPYHLYDMHVEGWGDYLGYYDSDGENSKTTYYYAIRRIGHAVFKKIPVDGSSKMPDGHMDAIAPFDFGKLQDFNPAYVVGYLTEVPDEDPYACLPRAQLRAVNSFEEDMKEDARHNSDIHLDGISETIAHETDVYIDNISSCVLPVWLAHCTWDDYQMLFAVNGDTGRCVGDLPVDKKRRVATVLGTLLACVLIAGLIIASMIGDADPDMITKFAVGAMIFTAIATLMIDGHFKSQMKTANEATTAEMSYDAQGLAVDYRWRSQKKYLRRNKALEQFPPRPQKTPAAPTPAPASAPAMPNAPADGFENASVPQPPASQSQQQQTPAQPPQQPQQPYQGPGAGGYPGR